MGDTGLAQAPLTRQQAGRLMRQATIASVLVAVLLVVTKALAWQASGSVSLLASLVDSLLDVLASLVNLLAVRHALVPADREHRFGHGKAEALAGLGQSLFIAGSGVFLLVSALGRLWSPVPLQAMSAGIAVMLLSIVLTLGLVLFQRYVIRRTRSTAIRADSLHYRADLLANASVIVALLLSRYGWQGFDALCALLIAIYIVASARNIARDAFDHLMDRELPDEDRDRVKALVAAHPRVIGMHDLRTRQSGADIFMQLHLELPDELPLVEAHQISEEVELALQAAFPEAGIIIHLDPISVVTQGRAAPL